MQANPRELPHNFWRSRHDGLARMTRNPLSTYSDLLGQRTEPNSKIKAEGSMAECESQI